MRITSLLAILLFVIIVFFAAPAASYGQTTASDQATPQNDTMALRSSPSVDARGDSTLPAWAADDPGNDVCYTMRTYVVAREHRSSDVVHKVGYRECLSSRRIRVLTSAEPAKDPAPADR